MTGILEVLDREPYWQQFLDDNPWANYPTSDLKEWSSDKNVLTPCDLPCAPPFRRAWWRSDAIGISRCVLLTGAHGDVHLGLLVMGPAPHVLSAYQWPRSEWDMAAE